MTKNTEIATYVDLFAGCGGLSLGLEWAGFNRKCAIENSPDASLTYFHNLIERQDNSEQWLEYVNSSEQQIARGFIVGDINSRFSDFIKSCKLRSDQIQLVAGGPPCQGFSTAGKRDPDDPRNKLINYINGYMELLWLQL